MISAADHVIVPSLLPDLPFVVPEFGKIAITSEKSEPPSRPPPPPSCEPPPTFHTDFVEGFEEVVGKDNLFPILLEISESKATICSKDCFISFVLDRPEEYEKVTLPEMPTCFKVHKNLIYLGLKSGTIIVFDREKKETLTSCQEFGFELVQIEIVSQFCICAMDLYGNLKVLKFEAKMFMDKIVKFSVNVVDVVERFRIKKRDKIRSLVKNLPFRSNKQLEEQSYDDSSLVQGTNESNGSVSSVDSKMINSKFNILPENLRNGNSYPLVCFYNSVLYLYNLDISTDAKISEEKILEDLPTKIGMIEMGEGGFSHSNQTHNLLVLSFENRIIFFRQIEVESQRKFIKINEIVHKCQILDGKFISNNIIIFLTSEGIEIANTNKELTLVRSVNYEKFNYIDFFNSELNLNFDKNSLYRNILRIEQETHTFVVLEGKRLIKGNIFSWDQYLLNLSEQLEWDKCMKCALMIYQEEITLLANIPESIEQRKILMRELVNKISLSYFSYSMKSIDSSGERDQERKSSEEETEGREEKSEENESQNKKANDNNPFSSIIQNVIDLLIRTESYTFLFSTIYEAVKSYGFEQNFMELLEKYIESGCIKEIDESMLDRIVQYYIGDKNPKEKNNNFLKKGSFEQRKNGLEYFIEMLDLSKIEKSLLLSVCLANQLYHSLIHICREQKDFVTPIIKLCGLRINLLNSINENKQEKEKQLKELTNATFEYLKECLAGHMTEFGKEESYIEMLQQIIGFIFIPSSLLMLLQSSPPMMFIIIQEIFWPKIMQYVLENSEKFKVKLVQLEKTQKNEVSDLEQLLEDEISECKYSYFSSLNRKGVRNSFIVFRELERSSEENENEFQVQGEFIIYSHMLTNIVFSIYKNYEKFHNLCTISKINLLEIEKSYIFDEVAESEFSMYHLHRFLTYLILCNSFPIRLSYQILAFEFLVVYPRCFFNEKKERSEEKLLKEKNEEIEEIEKDQEIENKEKNREKEQNENDSGAINSLLIRIIDSIVRECENFWPQKEKTKQIVLRKILSIIEDKSSSIENELERKESEKLFLTTKCYVLDLLNSYEELISCIMSEEDVHKHENLLKYLNFKVKDASFELKNAVVKNLGSLLNCSSKRTIDLLTEIFVTEIRNKRFSKTELLEICEKIKEFSDSQLFFLEEVIVELEKSLNLGIEFNSMTLTILSETIESLSLYHLSLVLKNKPNNVQGFIRRLNYPLEEAFKVCEQCNDKTAMAYILIKSGRNVEGVMIIVELFAQSARVVFMNLAKGVQIDQNEIEKMDEQLEKILDACSNEYNNDPIKGEEMWEKVYLRLFKELNIKAMDTIPIVKIREILTRYADRIISTLFSQVNSEFFINKFSQGKVNIPTRLYLQAYDFVQERLGFNCEIHSVTKELLRMDEMKLFSQLLQSNLHGISLTLTEKCCECDLSLNNEQTVDIEQSMEIKIFLFNCGHKYHKVCHTQSSMNSKKEEKMIKIQENQKIEQCPLCKNDFENYLHNTEGVKPEHYFLKRAKKEHIFIERSKKLAEFDDLGYFKIKGEELLSCEKITDGSLFA